MASVWLLEKGDHEDYELIGVFSARCRAESYVMMVPDARGAVPREVVIDEHVDRLHKGEKVYLVSMDLRTGDHVQAVADSPHRMSAPSVFNTRFTAHVWGRSPAAAVAAAEELRAAHLRGD